MKILKLLPILLSLIIFAACSGQGAAAGNSEGITLTDRDGDEITVPSEVNRIVSLGPSNTEVFVALGLTDKLVAIDTFSTVTERPDLPQFDMMQPNSEEIIKLNPDLVCVTGMSKAFGLDQFKPLTDVGITVTFVPSSNSVEDIKKDITFMGEITGRADKAGEIIGELTAQVENYRTLSSGITEKKKVYFELSAAPAMYSFGTGVFMHEMLEIIGAENIFADQADWLSVSDESVIAANPDFIFTNVSYIDNPVDEIKSRNGWEVITAVKENQVYQVSTNASSNPNHNIVIAMGEMARAMYPEIYGD